MSLTKIYKLLNTHDSNIITTLRALQSQYFIEKTSNQILHAKSFAVDNIGT